MSNRDHIVLAALEGGEHVQIGTACHRDDAHMHFEVLDSDLSGFYRTVQGALRSGGKQRPAFIGGKAVKFYRVRQVPNEFGTVRRFPLSAIRRTNRPKATKENHRMTISKTTPSGIQRPRTGGFARWDYARSVAKRANASGVGRGNRAIKAQDGNYTVIFRPAVVNNKQRKVRSV